MSDARYRLISESEAAEYLGLPHSRALYNERRGGRISWRKVAGRIMYAQEDLDEWQRSKAEAGSLIYFIQGDEGSPIKIGLTSWEEPAHRMALLQTGNPQKLRLLWAVSGDWSAENRLHRIFAADRMQGEWFACTPRLRDLIASLRNGAALADAILLVSG